MVFPSPSHTSHCQETPNAMFTSIKVADMCQKLEGNKIQADAISCLAKIAEPEFKIATLIAGKAYAALMGSCIHSHLKSSQEMVS